MRSKRILVGLAWLLTAVGLTGLAGWRTTVAQSLHRAASATERQAAAARTRVAQLEQERRHDEETENALRQTLHALATTTAAAPGPVAPAPRSQAFDVNQMIAERPELKALYEANAKAAEMESYGWLIVTLSPEAAERFKAERLRHDQQLSAITKTSREQGWDREDPRRQALRRAAEGQHAGAMAEILGASGLESYQAYEKTLRARSFVAGELARQLYFTESPLSPVQAQALTEVVERQGRDARGRFDFDAVNWDAVLQDARPQLEPAQFERLANLAEMRRLQSRVQAIETAFGARAVGK